MQQLVSQIPELREYLSVVPPPQHSLALAEVVRAGLRSMRTPCYQETPYCRSSLTGELDRIKENIESLNQQVRHQYGEHYLWCKGATQARSAPQKENEFVQTEPAPGPTVSFGRNQQVPTRETTAQFRDENVMTVPYNPFAKKRQGDPRLLDDKQVREALTFPEDPDGPRTTATQIMRRSLEHNQHKHQPEIDKEEKGRLRATKADEGTGRVRSRTDYTHIGSKIKARAERDRALYQQQQKQLEEKRRYQMYEYSDENQMEESSIRAEEYQTQGEGQRYYDQLTYNQHYQSSFRESGQGTSSKKPASSHKSRRSSDHKAGFERSSSQRGAHSQLEGASESKSQQSGQPSGTKVVPPPPPPARPHPPAEQDDDVISNSSSFSQFSISSSRRKEVGKISRRRHE